MKAQIKLTVKTFVSAKQAKGRKKKLCTVVKVYQVLVSIVYATSILFRPLLIFEKLATNIFIQSESIDEIFVGRLWTIYHTKITMFGRKLSRNMQGVTF